MHASFNLPAGSLGRIFCCCCSSSSSCSSCCYCSEGEGMPFIRLKEENSG